MRTRLSAVAMRAGIVGLFACSFAVVPMTTGTVSATPAHAGGKYLVSFANLSGAWTTENFNPLIPSGADDFTRGAIYEPLMVITQAGGGRTYKWLATGTRWTNHKRTLIVSLRHHVRWSDGKPFTSKDVAFTFNYGKSHNVDLSGLMVSGQITSVKPQGKYAVRFNFKTVDTVVLQQLLSAVCIIPEHIWKNVKNPLTFANSHPVGTGPFTQVRDFTSQEYTLARNKYYWQKLHYAGIRVPAFNSNTSALASMVKGQVDWAPVYIPDAKKAWVDVNPKYYHYFYSPPTTPLDMMFNDQAYPYSLPVLRQAVSMSIKRGALSVKAENGYEKPARALGLSYLYPNWVDHSLDKLNNKLSTFNPKAAKKMLRKAHFKWHHGKLYDPKGKRVSLHLICPAGWSDWQVQLQILAKSLSHSLGINATYDFIDVNTWLADRSSRTMGGKYGALFGTESSGQTPYQYFWSFMSKESYFPVNGQIPGGSWNIEGWYNNQATKLLRQFRQTTNRKLQHRIVNQLQKIDLQNLPVITTVTQAQWYTWSTQHFVGFPTAKNYYAYGPGYSYPDVVKVLTSLRPR